MSGRKNTLTTYHAVSSGDLGANLTSPVTAITYLDNVCIQLNFSGTPTGTFAVQTSIDYLQDSLGNIINAGNWITVPLTPAPIASGSADQAQIDLNEMPQCYFRVVYTRTSGTGTLNMYVTAKAIGS